MESFPRSRIHRLQLFQDGIAYGAVVQQDVPHRVYRFVSIWNQHHQYYLPLNDIEAAHVRRVGSLEATTLRSKRAARRRLRQYLRIWSELRDQVDGTSGGPPAHSL